MADGLAAVGMVASDYLIRTVSVLAVLAVAGLISSAAPDPAPAGARPGTPTQQAPTQQAPTQPPPAEPAR